MSSMPDIDWGTGAPTVLRQAYAVERAKIAHTCAPDVQQVDVTTITGPSIWFIPPNDTGTPILYFHGGGWVAGSPKTHVTLCSWLASTTGRRVLSVPYTLCPDAIFPSQYHDAARALDDFLTYEPAAIVAGDSAGAAMAFWAESGALQRVRVEAVISLYGALGASGTQSLTDHGGVDASMTKTDIFGMYARLGCPMGARMVQAIRDTGAPALLVTAGEDPLAHDHQWLMGQKPDRAMTEHLVPGQPHAFLQFAGMDDVAKSALRAVADWLDDL